MGLMDFFKADWKHSDPRVRQKSIERISDLEILAEILQTDEDQGVCQAVLKQLESISQAREVLQKLSGQPKEHLEKHLQKRYFESALKATSIDDAWLSELGQHQLSRIARESKSDEVQKAALDLLTDEKEISSVITHGDKKVAQLALSKVNDRESLQKLEKSSKSKGVKALVRKHYDALFGEEDRAEEKRLVSLGKLEKLVTLIEGMATLPDWSQLEKSFQSEQKKWQDLSDYATDELSQRYEQACEKCRHSQEEFKKKEEERLLQEKELAERMDRRRKVLSELNDAVEELQQDEVALLADYQQRWSLITPLSAVEEKEIEKRFLKAIETFPLKQAVLRDAALKKDLIKQNLVDLNNNLDELLQQDQVNELKKGQKSLYAEFKSLEKAGGADFNSELESLQSKFVKLNDKLFEIEAKLSEAREKLTGEYESIINEVLSFESQSKEKTARVKELQASWKDLEDLAPKEMEKLHSRFRKSCDEYFSRVKGAIEEREWNQFANLAAKEKLIESVRELAVVEDPVELAKKIKEKQAEWKTIGPVPQEKSDEVWEKFKTITDELYERCKEHYAQQDELRKKNAEAKEELCVKAESYQESTEWKETAAALKDLQAQWKAVGPAPRKQDKELWERFRAACDSFFNRRSSYFAERDSQREENTTKKEALVLEIEKVPSIENSKEAAAKIKQLQSAWKEIGPAEREKEQELWKRFRAVADEFFDKRRQNYEKLQADFEVNVKPKQDLIDGLCGKVKALSEESDWTSLAQEFRQSQQDIKSMASAGFEKDKELRLELKKVCDQFFEARNAHYDQLSSEDQENLNIKEEYCLKVELLAESSEWRETAEELKKLQTEFKDLASVNEKYDGLMFKRFNSICQEFFDRRREHFEEQDEARHENLKKKKQLCVQMEKLAGVSYTTIEAEASSVEDMAAQLQNAFDNNFGGYDTAKEKPKSFKEAAQEARELQAAWKNIGPVPKEDSQQIWESFRKAADIFYSKRNDFFAKQKSSFTQNLQVKQEILKELKGFANEEKPNFGKVKALQKRWRDIGDVPRENFKELQAKYRKYCDSIYQKDEKENVSSAEGEVRI